jgi:hypothetical protein
VLTFVHRPPLTDRQFKVYRFVLNRIAAGACPTIRELMVRFNFTSPNGALSHLKALVKKGYLARGGRSRSRAYRLAGAVLVPVVAQDLPLALDAFAAGAGDDTRRMFALMEVNRLTGPHEDDSEPTLEPQGAL